MKTMKMNMLFAATLLTAGAISPVQVQAEHKRTEVVNKLAGIILKYAGSGLLNKFGDVRADEENGLTATKHDDGSIGWNYVSWSISKEQLAEEAATAERLGKISFIVGTITKWTGYESNITVLLIRSKVNGATNEKDLLQSGAIVSSDELLAAAAAAKKQYVNAHDQRLQKESLDAIRKRIEENKLPDKMKEFGAKAFGEANKINLQ